MTGMGVWLGVRRTGVASKSFGSALAQVGETKAFASIVLHIGQPAQDTPDCGELGEFFTRFALYFVGSPSLFDADASCHGFVALQM